MARRVIGIICYCISGFFLYTVSVASFVNDPAYHSPGAKLLIIAIFLIPALIFLGIGLILRRLKRKYDIAIMLLSVSAFSIFVIFSIFCFFISPEFRKLFPDNKIVYFNDYFAGALCLLIFICLGLLLLANSKSKRII